MISYKPIGPSTERVSSEHLAINSCGIEYLSAIDRGSLRKNGRVDYHILYIAHGVCYLQTENGQTQVGAGGVVLFRPGEMQCYNFLAADQSVSYYIHFTGTGCEQLLDKLGLRALRVFDMGISETYEEIAAKMVREYTMKRPHWESFAAGCLYEMLALIARQYALRHDKVSVESESRISAACRKLYENLASPPSIAQLAAESCLSVSRFSHLFSEVVGKSPNEFLLCLRMERACELLESSSLPIREIAQSVGCADQNYFSRLFKERIGCSPSQYRKNCRT